LRIRTQSAAGKQAGVTGMREAEIFLQNYRECGPHLLHEIIVNLSDRAPAWLLLDAHWVHT
jgi:hypothetical protein